MIILRKKQKRVKSLEGVVVNSDFVHEEAAQRSRIFFKAGSGWRQIRGISSVHQNMECLAHYEGSKYS